MGMAIGNDPASPSAGPVMFVADADANQIKEVPLNAPANVTVIAGSGIAGWGNGHGNPLNAKYNGPRGLAAMTDGGGNVIKLIIGDTNNDMIRVLTWTGSSWLPDDLGGIAQTTQWPYVEGGPGVSTYNAPQAVAVDPASGRIYVADSADAAIRQIDGSSNTSTLTTIRRSYVVGITLDASGRMFITDQGSGSLYSLSMSTLTISTLVNNLLSVPFFVTWANASGGEVVYVADRTSYQIKQYSLASSTLLPYAGNGTQGYVDGVCTTQAEFGNPRGLVFGPGGGVLYISDSSNLAIRTAQ
jgi:DNA-binding beta-propeller fold protein YncE